MPTPVQTSSIKFVVRSRQLGYRVFTIRCIVDRRVKSRDSSGHKSFCLHLSPCPEKMDYDSNVKQTDPLLGTTNSRKSP